MFFCSQRSRSTWPRGNCPTARLASCQVGLDGARLFKGAAFDGVTGRRPCTCADEDSVAPWVWDQAVGQALASSTAPTAPSLPARFNKGIMSIPETDEHSICPPWRRADAPVVCDSENGWLDQWRRHAGHMCPRCADGQRMRLKNRQWQCPHRQAHTLVAHATQLASSVVAFGIFNACICQRRRLRMGLVRGLRHGLVAIVRRARLPCAVGRRGEDLVRKSFYRGHPCARPQPQGHQAQQEAKKKSTHFQIISQTPSGLGFEPECPF